GALHGGGVNLSAYPLVLDLAHLVSPRRLVDVLRKSRRGDLQGAGESALEALDDCARFLQGLAEKVRA
ncbi:MAG TPA: hypothetical protein VL359_18700, partial [bacterium]|nr:hypothetical protein [bacterium]